jgi:prepilin-type N-terminal cleavage/methylation domain-containing protein
MHKVALFLLRKTHTKFLGGITQQRYLTTQQYDASPHAQHNAGFTLLEMIVVVVMVGILAAIVGPSWLAFVNRQQVNKANDTILAAIQEAQREAKKNKRRYSVSFRTNSNVPQIAIHLSSASPNWKNLGEDLEIKPGKIVLGTNLSATNTVSSPSSVAFNNLTTPKTITFDNMGALAPKSNGSASDTEIKVTVAVPISGSTTSPSETKRCVIIATLIGAMRTAKDSNCN